MDTLSIANDLALEQGIIAKFDVTIVGVRESIYTGQGLKVLPTLATSLPSPDLVIVPALAETTPEGLSNALQRPAQARRSPSKWP